MSVTELCSITLADLLLAVRNDYYTYPSGITTIRVPDDMTPTNLAAATLAFSFLSIKVHRRNSLLVAEWKNVTDAAERQELIRTISFIMRMYVNGKRYVDIQMCCRCPMFTDRKKIIKGFVEALGWRVMSHEKLCLRVSFYGHRLLGMSCHKGSLVKRRGLAPAPN